MTPRTLTELAPSMTARSVALSLLLGARPPRLHVRELISAGDLFEIAASSMRAALSRMVAAGEMTMADSFYSLGPRHMDRQASQEAMIRPRRRPFDGVWEQRIIVTAGRQASSRAEIRKLFAVHRFAELREGVWMRPANLVGEDLEQIEDVLRFETTVRNSRTLVRELWDLETWASEAKLLLVALSSPGHSKERFMAAAGAVRHLCSDPALPDEHLPEYWPGDELRWAYEDYRAEFTQLSMNNAKDLQ